MVCIYCGTKTAVVNSRLQKKANRVWRRRSCPHCRSVFTSLEGPDWATGLSVLKNSHYAAFQRDKLFLSVYESLKHRKAALNEATALTDTVLSQLLPAANGSIERDNLVRLVLGVLARYDKAAATYYAAYHSLG